MTYIKEGYASPAEQEKILEQWLDGKIDMKMYQLEEAFGTASFTNALVDAANVSAMQAFGEVPAVWKAVSKIVPRNDFKTNYVVVADGLGLLEKRLEHEPATGTKPTDGKESYAVFPYDKVFSITMEAWANDATDVLKDQARKWGHAGVNTLNDFVWGTSGLLGGTGQTMRDSNALFDATNHGNYATSEALDYTGLNVAWAAMRNQTDQGGTQKLGVSPKILAVSPDIYTMAVHLTQSPNMISTTTANVPLGEKNPWGSMGLEVVVVDSLPAGEFVLAADPNIYPVIEMGFYEGRAEPEVLMQGPDSDDEFFRRRRNFKCQLIFGGTVLEWRTLYKGT
ncbi:MAG: hypothetical protein AMJ65_16440 [Phycisphaerae bacterium SG8_4]|nr:MAG: hypothetical protein AMJ65_16440 [Phycisphaerae bacterium SG8_4]